MKKYKFAKHKLSTPEHLWLEEIDRSKFKGMNERYFKVKLKDKLPRNFKPDSIDRRYVKDNRLTLLGIWYVNHKHPLLIKTSKVINTMQKLISDNPYMSLFTSNKISKLTDIDEDKVKFIFRIMHDFELVGGYKIKQGELYPYEVSFSDNHSGFEKILYFENISETLEDFFIEKEPQSFILNNVGHKTQNVKNSLVDHSVFVDYKRIEELEKIKTEHFDLTRLIELCNELNHAKATNSYLAIAMITRTIINHIPPIFNCETFKEVANNYKGGKSFRDLMLRLDMTLRKIADNHLHKPISSREVLPNFIQVNFTAELDLLISEIISILKKVTKS